MTLTEKSKEINKTVFSPFAVIIPAVILFMMLFMFDQTALSGNMADVIGVSVAVGGTAVCLAYGVFSYVFNRISKEKIITLLLLCGFFIRLGYVIVTTVYTKQHDVESLSSSGHLSYIYRFVTGAGLPDSNNWQFCHPPLHHYLASVAVKMSLGLDQSLECAFENIQLLTLTYSYFTSVIWCKILNECGVKGKAFIITSAVAILHPTLIIFAGSINNDPLTLLLSSAAMLWLIRWHRSPTVVKSVIIGALVGLAMMTKFSAALIAAVIGISVLIRFIRDKQYGIGKFALQAGSFLAVMLPTGMWYQVRNLIKFGQPIGYVAPLPVTSDLYTGNVSLLQRFIIPPMNEVTKLFCAPFEDTNVIAYTLRCSVFGEYKWTNLALCGILLVLNVVLVLFGIFGAIWLLPRKNCFKDINTVSFFVLWVIQLAFFVYFYLSSPFGCTMDFRYIVPALLANLVLLGRAAGKWERSDSSLGRSTFGLFAALATAFCTIGSFALF